MLLYAENEFHKLNEDERLAIENNQITPIILINIANTMAINTGYDAYNLSQKINHSELFVNSLYVIGNSMIFNDGFESAAKAFDVLSIDRIK